MKIKLLLQKIVNICPFFLSAIIIVVTMKNLIGNESWLGYERGTQCFSFLLCLLLLMAFSFVFSVFSPKIETGFYILGWIAVLIWQVLIIFKLYSDVGWDAGMVVNAAYGNMPDEASEYLSIYPNNLFLVYIYRVVFRIFAIPFAYRFLAAALLNLVFMNATFVFLYFLSGRILGRNGRLLTMLYFVLLIGVSPWMIIPYSDLAAMPFTVGIVLFYLRIAEKKDETYGGYKAVLLSLGAGALLFMGFKIKPTSIIPFIAVCIMFLIFGECRQLVLGKILAGGFCSFIIFCCLWNGFTRCQKDFVIDADRSVSYAHYLMLGLNDNYGCYTEEDIAITLSAKTKEEKVEKNFEVIEMRLRNMGIDGLLIRWWKKLCRIHSEGNFFWGGEGGMNFLNFDLSQNPLLRNIFYINGKYYPYYKYFVQGIWLSLCAFIGFNIFKIKGKRQKNQNEINLVFLVIIGIILFNLLFEARSRYLISFLPFYAMAAARGTEIIGIIGNQLQKRLHSSKHYAKLFTL